MFRPPHLLGLTALILLDEEYNHEAPHYEIFSTFISITFQMSPNIFNAGPSVRMSGRVIEKIMHYRILGALWPQYGPGVDSASKRNECQQPAWG
jgi:hypothetical protein